jgi:hypothetical protein
MWKQLFSPFRFGQWVRLAIVGFLAGEMGGGSGFNIPGPPGPGGPQPTSPELAQWGPLIIAGVALLIVLVLALGLLFLYISSRMRFVLFDSVVHGECRIREFWRGRGRPAFRYFVWQIGFSLIASAAIVLLIVPPLLAVYFQGWFESPGEHFLGWIVGGLVLLLLLFVVITILTVTHVLTKDFVIPQMALEDLTAMEGWRRLWPMMKAAKGSYAGYIGMKIVLAIGAGIISSAAAFIVILVLLIPFGGIGLAGVLGGAAAGLEWNPVTIGVAVLFGLLALAVLIFALALIAVPVTMFFPTYALCFFAGRYPPLDLLMNPSASGSSPGVSPV